MHKFLFFHRFIIFFYIFRALLCSSSGGQIVLYSIWYHHTCRWPSGAPDGHLQAACCHNTKL